MERLQPAQETKISAAITKMADYMADGKSPLDAAAQAATDEQLPPGHAALMARAYNNGRMLSQYAAGSSVAEKAANVPVIDPAELIARLYPAQPKLASDLWRDDAVSPEYSKAPVSSFELEKRATLRAVDLHPKATAPTRQPMNPDKPLQKVAAARDLVIKEAANRKAALQTACSNMVVKLAAMVDAFRKPGLPPFETICVNATSLFGKAAAPLLDEVRAARPLTTKFASLRTGQGSANSPARVSLSPYREMQECLDAAAVVRAAEKRAAEDLRPAAVVVDNALSALRPPVLRTNTGSIYREKSADLGDMGLGAAIGALGSGVAGRMVPPTRQELVTDAMDKLSENDTKLQTIRTQALLHDLMLNDPIISSHPHANVVEAFNRLSETVPRAAQNRMVMQTALRKYLEQGGAMDLFDTNKLLETEDYMADRRVDLPPSMLDMLTQKAKPRTLQSPVK